MGRLKKLRPGIYGTPGAFSEKLLDELMKPYKSHGPTYKFDSKEGLKQVLKKAEELKIAKKKKKKKDEDKA